MYEAWGLVDGSWIKGFEVGVDAKTGLTPFLFTLKLAHTNQTQEQSHENLQS